MKNILIDAGPIIALYNKNDEFHDKILKFLQQLEYQYVSTWPVVTETLHMLKFNVHTQIDFLKWLEDGGITLFDLNQSHLKRIRILSEKYSDVPIDLADASLIIASEELKIEKIISIDSEFNFYKNIRNKYLINIFKK